MATEYHRIKLCDIVPHKWLHYLQADRAWTSEDMFLLLAQEISRNQDYAAFFRQNNKGAYLIMDNGAFEGETVDLEEVIHAANGVGADEIVVPDSIGDVKKSLASYYDFIDNKQRLWQGNHMVILQGKSVDEAIEHFYLLHDIWKSMPESMLKRVILGVPKHFGARRMEVVRRLITLPSHVNQVKILPPIHLLGYASGNDWLIGQQDWFLQHIRSMDTSACAIWAYEGDHTTTLNPLYAAPKRPDDFFNLPVPDLLQRVEFFKYRKKLRNNMAAL